MRLRVLLATALLLSACVGGDEPAAEQSRATPEAVAATNEAVTDDPATTTADAVVLEADGVATPLERLAFDDAEQGAVVAAVGSVLERGPTAHESQLECGPGPLDSVSWDGLDLYFSGGTFAGWFLDQPQPAGVTTAGDVQLDTTTLRDLRTTFPDVTVEESTIGIEWLGGDLSGTLASDSDSGTVEAIWAGATCIAR